MSQLQLSTTAVVGGTGSTKFGYDVGDVKRIVKIEVNHGINIDGLRVTYELMDGKRKEMPWLGYRKGENNDTVELAFDEEISSIEVGFSDLIRRLAFNTTTGRRFPESKNLYYGRGHDNRLEYTRIEAPRVCGLVGYSGALIDSIGLRYRELAEQGVASRDFLLEMEPNLFPSNIPKTIDMTVKGILAAGNWRREEDLRNATTEDARNTLIVVLNGYSNQRHYQGFNNDALVGKGAIVVFLLKAGYDQSQLQKMSDGDHRNTVITYIHTNTDEPVPALQALGDGELVRWGFAIKGDTALATTAMRMGA
jgi:Jacalin-like lectin domain